MNALRRVLAGLGDAAWLHAVSIWLLLQLALRVAVQAEAAAG
jgi:hypothetical protein